VGEFSHTQKKKDTQANHIALGLIWARPQHYHCMERVGIRRLELELEALKEEKDHAQRHLSLQQWKFSPQNFLE